ncbi:MAG: M48 family metalloprotease [Rhodocyclaceae bacterium]
MQVTDAKPEDFHFFALRDPTINAFAMPGGFIGVHSGLVLASQSESELAGVLAHEIGHVQQHHIARMLDKQSTASATMLAAFLLAILAAGRGPSGSAMAQATLAGTQAALIQNQLSYSQDFEREADRIGFQTLSASGFDVRGMANFFERLGKAMRTSERSETAYLRTHPLSVERMADMQGRAQGAVPGVVADSNDYVLIRARMDAEAGLPKDALVRIQARQAPRRQDQAAKLYALARVYTRDNRAAEAQKALADLRAMRFESPLVDSMVADMLLRQGKAAEAEQVCSQAFARYSDARFLLLCQVQALTESGKPERAAQMARDALVDTPSDERLWILQAKAYAAQGKVVEQQRAMAELYVVRGNLIAAVEQLQLAQRGGGGDFYTQSAVDSRLRELRNRLREERREGRPNGLQ